MTNETKSYGEEIAVESRPLQSQIDELLARVEMLRREESFGNDEEYPAVYPEDPKEEEQLTGLNPDNYLDEVISRFGERDLQVSFEPTLMGRFDGKRLYHLEAYGQKRDVTEMMEKADPAEKAHFERRLEELALDGQSFDFNEETGEVIVHIVIGENYYTFAFSGRSAEGGESTAFTIEDGEALPPRQEEAPYSPVAVEVLDLNPVLGSERGVNDPAAREETVASQPVFDAQRASEGEEMIAGEKSEVQERAPMPEPAVGPEMKLESRPISEPAEIMTNSGSQGIGLAIERAPEDNLERRETEIASVSIAVPAARIEISLADRQPKEAVVEIKPSFQSQIEQVGIEIVEIDGDDADVIAPEKENGQLPVGVRTNDLRGDSERPLAGLVSRKDEVRSDGVSVVAKEEISMMPELKAVKSTERKPGVRDERLNQTIVRREEVKTEEVMETKEETLAQIPLEEIGESAPQEISPSIILDLESEVKPAEIDVESVSVAVPRSEFLEKEELGIEIEEKTFEDGEIAGPAIKKMERSAGIIKKEEVVRQYPGEPHSDSASSREVQEIRRPDDNASIAPEKGPQRINPVFSGLRLTESISNFISFGRPTPITAGNNREEDENNGIGIPGLELELAI